MNIELIVGQIDDEIEKLKSIRVVLQAFLEPKLRAAAKPRPARINRALKAEPEPRLVILPPKQRREYTRRVRPVRVESKALAAPVSSLPVFVPKAVLRPSAIERIEPAEGALEVAMRRKLLGGLA